jgi:hypothetical protein
VERIATKRLPELIGKESAMDERTRVDESMLGDLLLRAVGIFGLLGIGLIHFLDVFGKFKETPYLAWLYLALIAGCLVASTLLLRPDARLGWSAAFVLSAATFTGYVLSRTTGLPAATGDIGNWTEPLGLASLFVEGLVMATSIMVLSGAASRIRRSTWAPQFVERTRSYALESGSRR